MPFIGNQPALSYTSFAKQDFTTSATTSYTLDQPVANANELALFINFVRQEPTTAYTASGTSLTLTSATSASDDMYCVFLGKAVQTVNPPSGSVGTAQLADSSVSLAKLSATGTKNATTFLRGDNTFASAGGTMTPAFHVSLSAIQQTTDLVITKVQFNTESFDTDNCFDNSTNYRFTPTTAGKYFVYFSISGRSNDLNQLVNLRSYIYKNGSELIKSIGTDFRPNNGFQTLNYTGAVIDMNGSTDYIEFFARVDHTGGVNGGFDGGSYAGAYKIIE